MASVQKVLDARVGALRRGDESAFLATLDPEAPDEFRRSQAQSFEGLRALPLAFYRLTARTADSGDLSTGLSARYGGARVFLPETRQTYRFRDYDDRDAVDSLWLTFVERGGRWYVGGDDDLSALGVDTARNVWDLGPVQVKRTAHFLVISHPAQAARADVLAGIAEEAMATLNSRWDRPWSDRIPLILPGSVHELETTLQTTFDLNNFVAFVAYGTVRDRDWQTTAPRIYIQDQNLERYPRRFQTATLVHELSHAAAAPLDGPFVPAWVHEGVAEWVAKGALSRPKGSDGRLPRDYEFTTGKPSDILLSYDESHSAIGYLGAHDGEHTPTLLLTALGTPKVAPGSVDEHVDDTLRRLLNEPFDIFQQDWSHNR